MNKILILLLSATLLTGCASIERIDKNYLKINFRDGISKNEAIIMAQKVLLDSGEINKYIYEKPIFDNDPTVQEQIPNHVFIHFAPVAGDNEGFLVIINEKSGEVRYSGPFNPVRDKNYEMILN